MVEEKIYFTRFGDGSSISMTEAEIRQDILSGISDAVTKGKIEGLSEEDIEALYQIVIMDVNIVGVKPGCEVVSTSDSGCFKINYQAHVPMDRSTAVLVNERVLCVDSVDIGNIDYSYKSVKPILHDEAKVMQLAQAQSIIPILYGGMPDLGRYTKPDGPVDNWSELIPMGKIKEGMDAQEEAIEHAVKDMVYIAKGMVNAGADGISLLTSGASGDADFMASLKAAKIISNEIPNFGIEIGMAGEFVLGMHGKLKFEGTRVAGLYPQDQVKVAQKAGATIFAPVVSTNSNKSFPWNIARAVTLIKACTKAAEIPVHVNIGMGMGGSSMSYVPPTDVTSKAAKAMVEIANVDGILISSGDPFGNDGALSIASCMGGIRSAGDLVLRMQLNKGMKLNKAKAYVAEKLGVRIEDLSDCSVMQEIREELNIGYSMPSDKSAKGLEAKFNIAKLLDIKINSVELFKKKTG